MGKFRKCVKYDNRITGEGRSNPMYNKQIYEVDCHDGTTKLLTATTIAINMLSQADSKGHNFQVLTEIIDHKKDNSAIRKMNGFVKSINGNIHRKMDDLWLENIGITEGIVSLLGSA